MGEDLINMKESILVMDICKMNLEQCKLMINVLVEYQPQPKVVSKIYITNVQHSDKKKRVNPPLSS